MNTLVSGKMRRRGGGLASGHPTPLAEVKNETKEVTILCYLFPGPSTGGNSVRFRLPGFIEFGRISKIHSEVFIATMNS